MTDRWEDGETDPQLEEGLDELLASGGNTDCGGHFYLGRRPYERLRRMNPHWPAFDHVESGGMVELILPSGRDRK